jgi:hypothetical protein
MIAFVSLFLGLLLGTQTVEVAVGDDVAAVEVLLDGHSVGVLTGAPWRLPCDFGAELAPHELVAVARNDAGREIGRTRQWINLPRPPAEVTVVLEGGQDGRGRFARLTWESVVAGAPRSVAVSLDGQPLAAPDPQRIELPPYDPHQLHLLRAEVDFSDTVSSVAEVVFGGTYADEVNSELTAVPVALAPGVELPPAERLAGWFVAGGAALEVVAVENGSAEVVVVRDEAAVGPLDRIQRALNRQMRGVQPAPLVASSVRQAMPLGRDQRLRLLSPFPEMQQGVGKRFALFPASPEFTAEDAGVYWLISRWGRDRSNPAPQQLADAVAVAGLAAAGRKRRRAVVLVLGREPEDASELTPALTRAYLERLQIPFRVWQVERKPRAAASAWGEAEDVSDAGHFGAAVGKLVKALDRQRIVWVRGVHLPQEVALGPGAPAGVELAR